MDVFKSQGVPCLALVLGNEVTLTSLQQSFSAFPQGVTYPEFRHVLLSYLAPTTRPITEKYSGSPTPSPLPVSVKATGLQALPTLSRLTASFAFAEKTTAPEPGTTVTTAVAVESVPAATSSSPSEPLSRSHVQREQDANREEARVRRVRARQELAGLSAAPVDPIKQLFNRINVNNEQRVTWENLLDYVVAEAGDGVAEMRYNDNRTKIYSFSRALRCPTKQHHHRQQPQSRQDGNTMSTETLSYKRFYRGIQETQMSNPRAKTGSNDGGCADGSGNSNSNGSGGTRSNPGTILVEDDLSLVRMVDGLESHNAVFFVSSRSHPFLLYGKYTHERVFAAPPDMLDVAVPTAVAYLAEIDFFLCYSTDDRLLRGWYALLSQSIATVAVTPLLVEGFVRRMRVMPSTSPTYADYADGVFLGDSYGHILHITVPRGRAGGMEFTVEHTYKGLHTRSSGGLVDFCVYGSYLYSSGFDGRVVATSLVTGQSSDIGSVGREHLHALVYVPLHNGLVAATSSTRQLLWWEVGAQSALPGVPFQHAGYGDHAAAIVAVVYMADSDYLASADCDGVVKVWEMVTHRCVQSFHSNRLPSGNGNDAGGHSGSNNAEEATPRMTLKSQDRAQRCNGAAKSISNFTAASAGRDMMMLTHNGLHTLLSESSGMNHLGSAPCHSLSYCTETEELMCGFANAITCWGLHCNKNPYKYDAEEVCQDVLYDVRTQTFLLRSATKLSVWDGVHGVRRGLLDRTKVRNATHKKVDIKSVCLDDLGSRVFLSVSDGNVYIYATQLLTADTATDKDEPLQTWNAFISSFTTTTAVYGNTSLPSAEAITIETSSPPAPVQVEQMHFFSTLRTWVAITSAGTLLVCSEADKQQTAFVATINVSPLPLRLLRVSEELGLVAVVDAQHSVYLYHMEAWTDTPATCPLSAYGQIVDLTFLDAAPVLLTVHVGGVCYFWSCPPAVECFELLSTIEHPQLPAAATVSTSMKEGVPRGVLRRPVSAAPSAVAAASVRADLSAKVLAPLSVGEGTTTGPITEPTNKAVTHPNPVRLLTVTPRSKTAFSMTGRSKTKRISTRGSHHLASAMRDLLNDSSSAACRGAAVTAGVAATTLCDSRSVSPESFIMNPEERAKALSAEVPEFTSVSYDGRSHHLFLGDTQGVVYIYRVCELLRWYKLPKCSYSSRPAFSLFTTDRTYRSSPQGDGYDNADDQGGDSGDGSAHAATAAPVLVRSVEVHVSHRDHSVGRRRSPSIAAAATPQNQQQQQLSNTKSHKREAGGVVCVRWIASRGVLVTSGNDHEVWLLNADGDKLGFFSAERLPPRPKKTLHAASSLQMNNAPPLEPLAASLLNGKSAGFEDTLPLQRPFFLPPAKPIVEEVDEASPSMMTVPSPANPPVCCTHPDLMKGGDTSNHTPKAVFFQAADCGAAAPEAVMTFRVDEADGHAEKLYALPFPPKTGPVKVVPHSIPPARVLVDYLASENVKAPTMNKRKVKSSVETVPTSCVPSPSTHVPAFAYAAASLASRPLPLCASQKRVHRSPRQLRFTKSGKTIQNTQTTNVDSQANPHCAADECGTAERGGHRSSSFAGTTNNVAVAAPTAPYENKHLQTSPRKDVNEFTQKAYCSNILDNTGVSTLPNVATPLSPIHAAELPDRESFWQIHKIDYKSNMHTPSGEATTAEAAATGALETSLWITGVPLGNPNPSTRPYLPADVQHSSLIRHRHHQLEFSARTPTRHDEVPPLFMLRPKTTGGMADGFYHGRLDEHKRDRIMPSLSSISRGRSAAPSTQRAATASTARLMEGSGGGRGGDTTMARVSPMLVYTSVAEGSETLELYSRELRQRLRRPRRSNV